MIEVDYWLRLSRYLYIPCLHSSMHGFGSKIHSGPGNGRGIRAVGQAKGQKAKLAEVYTAAAWDRCERVRKEVNRPARACQQERITWY